MHDHGFRRSHLIEHRVIHSPRPRADARRSSRSGKFIELSELVRVAAPSMGANKTFQQKDDRGRLLGESDEFKRLQRAIDKADGDREHALRNVCRLYGVNRLDALPGAIRAATLALLNVG